MQIVFVLNLRLCCKEWSQKMSRIVQKLTGLNLEIWFCSVMCLSMWMWYKRPALFKSIYSTWCSLASMQHHRNDIENNLLSSAWHLSGIENDCFTPSHKITGHLNVFYPKIVFMRWINDPFGKTTVRYA